MSSNCVLIHSISSKKHECEAILPHGATLDIISIHEAKSSVEYWMPSEHATAKYILACDPDTPQEERAEFIAQFKNCRSFDEVKSTAIQAKRATRGDISTLITLVRD